MAIVSSFEDQLNHIVDGLADKGFAVVDQFMPESTTLQLLQLLKEMKEEGDLRKAGIGKQLHFQVDKTIRGDYIKWIEKDTAPALAHTFLERIEALMQFINRTCFLGLKDYESHFAVYPAGTFYKRHADRFQQNPHRIISFVYYLNEGWTYDDGGILRLYLPQKTEDIAPIAGRLACFKSEIEHEVLLSHKTRYSMTGWMRDQVVSLPFL